MSVDGDPVQGGEFTSVKERIIPSVDGILLPETAFHAGHPALANAHRIAAHRVAIRHFTATFRSSLDRAAERST
jgi:hypothetical protein